MSSKSLDGILIIDKPDGWTSHDVVAKLRGVLKIRRIGHTGTLDPFATGVLVVCLNRATRLVQFLTGHEKEYVARMRLGMMTDTGDLTGEPVGEPVEASHVTSELFAGILDRFRGRISQIPPMYSAKKIGGKRLYELAREGKEIERRPIEVTISALEMVRFDLGTESVNGPEVTIRVACSAGTYIRTLAEDIGKGLGVGAHLVALRRTRAGRCTLDRALTIEQVSMFAAEDRLHEIVIPMRETLDLPEVTIDEAAREAICHGRQIRWPEAINLIGDDAHSDGERLLSLCGPSGELLAIAESVAPRGMLSPRIVFASLT